MKNAKISGYKIRCIYVLTCNPDINVARIKSRFCEGGHDVPEDKIRSRYTKALKLLPQLVNAYDNLLIYDNSIMPTLLFKNDDIGNEYYLNEIWSIDKLKNLLN